MGIARSTCYHQPKGTADDTALVEAMHAIKDEFEAYGWRRMQAALRHRGWVVNHKKIKRLMREHALQPPRRRRFVATTDSDHDEPVFPDRSRDCEVDGPNQLWVADLTYIAILGGFVYLAAIMDAWSRRIVGYALGRRIDARLTLAALTAAIEDRIRGEPPATRQAIRWTESAPLVNAFGVWLDEQRSRVSPRSRLGEKLAYIANQWDRMLVFLFDGRVELDSNFVENRIRPIALSRKNALFAGHDEGARAWGRIDELLPWNFQTPSSRKPGASPAPLTLEA